MNDTASAIPTTAQAPASAADVRALTWVRDEVRRSLDAAQKALQRYVRESEALRDSDVDRVDPSVLRSARSHLHQASGALELVGLAAPARLVRAGELAVQRMIERPKLVDAAAVDALERAWLALADYLARLMVGKPVSGVSLFPHLRPLLERAGAERVHPADLWALDWSWRSIDADPQAPALAVDARSQEAMERLILRLMRTPDRTTLRRMSDLCAALGAGEDGRRATLWRLASGFFEAQAAGLLRVDVYVKRAAPRLLALLRQGLQAGEVSDRLAHDMLFFCAQAVDPGEALDLPRWRAVLAAYGLGPASVPDHEAPSLGRLDPAVLAQARKRLGAAREAWAAAAHGELPRVQSLHEAFALMHDSIELLLPQGSELGRALMRAAAVASPSQPLDAALAMEVATAVLYLEAAVDDTTLDDPQLPQRVLRLSRRIDDVRQGLAVPPLEPWMVELFRRVSDAQTMGSVVQELRGTLADAEAQIDRYFREPHRRDALDGVPARLDGLRGVLAVLGLDPATQALARVREDIELIAHTAATGPDAAQRDQELLDRLADNLGALHFVTDILAVQPMLARWVFRFDHTAQRLRAEVPSSVPALVSAGGFDGVAGSSPAGAAPPVSAAPDVPLPTAPATAPTTSLEADDDDGREMLEVFLEESGEVLEAAQQALSNLARADRDPAGDLAEMTAVRRAFHTLKGSSRMVGLAGFGEAAWACEQLYNARLAAEPGLDPALRAFSLEALAYLGDWRDAIAARQPRGHDAAAVRVAADALRQEGRRIALPPLPQPEAATAAVAAAPEAPAAAGWPEAADGDDPGETTIPSALDEPVKVVGPLRIEIAMFNVFLNEADELSRRLATRLAEWGTEPHEPPGEGAVVLAHSLAGGAATVGFQDLSGLARALEHALARSNASGRLHDGEPALYTEAADEIRRMLHQFAAGFLVQPRHELPLRLDAHLPEVSTAPPLSEAPPGLPADTATATPTRSPAVAEPIGEEAAPFALAAVDLDLPDLSDPVPAAEDESVEVPVEVPVDRPLELQTPTAARAEAPPADAIPTLDIVLDAPPDAAQLADAPQVADDGAGRAAQPKADTGAAIAPDDEPAGTLSPWVPQDDDIDLDDAVEAELLPVFAEEAEELLPRLSGHLRSWLASPTDRAAAEACLRTLHTFKGAARLAGAMRLGEMAHRLEGAVGQLAVAAQVSPAEIEPLTWRVDALRAAYQALRDVPASPQVAPAATVSAVPAAPPPAEPGTTDLPTLPAALVDDQVTLGIDWSRFARPAALPGMPERPTAPLAGLGAVRVKASLLDRLVNQAGETSIARTRIESDLAQVKASLADLTDNLDRLRRQLRDVEVQAEVQIISRMEATKAAAVAFDPLEMDRYTRVQELTRMMAESVNDVATVQRSLQRALQSSEDQVALQGRLVRAMQDDLMRTRMVEFDSLSDRLYRVVRQAAKETGKQVRLDIVGGALEIDRGVLERMTAPFEHLLRNSIAHGIERPGARTAAGKDPAGLIEIRLAPEGNEVAIELSDDGAGLDLRRIRERAVAAGLLKPQDTPGDGALAELIFAPGFSTADQVTELAGRGVGMDVVRSEVMALGGRIQTATTPGRGTRFRLVLPLTTAVTQVAMLRCGDWRVAVPSNLVEVVRREDAARVEAAYRSGRWTHGDESLPFHWLGALLDREPAGAAQGTAVPVVIVRSAAQRVALHVDEVQGNQEVVVKHLGPQLARLPGLTGITLLASGAIAAIYNPVALVAWYGDAARLRVEQLLAERPAGAPLVVERGSAPPAPLVLVVDDSLTVRRVTQRLLVREGYRVVTAKDGIEALERIGQERPTVVLSDIEMPRMDGYDFVRQLRADPRLASLPVIMISSRIAQKHRDHARDLGVRHYLGKPYGEEELLGVVARLARPDGDRME